MNVESIPGYRDLQLIGAGGFARVYRAVRTATGRAFAIKVVDVDRVEPRHRQARIRRFEREVSLCRDLHHPHIVGLIDRGQSDGLPYAVFEYVDGMTLADTLRVHGPLPAGEAADLMAQVLDALACAHGHGVVHRDLKPVNIMLTNSGARTSAMVLDFGIGTFLPGVRAEDNATITGTLEVPGTPAYSSPEQLRGDAVTVRSDLYSWGLVFLECLTARRAIAGATAAEIYHEHLSPEEVLLPPAIARHSLGRLLRTALRKDPKQRAASAAALLDGLRRIHVADLVGAFALPASARRSGSAASPKADTWAGNLAPGTRRLVTTLSCSLQVIPLDGASFDPELLAAFQADQLAACIECCSAFGGKVLGPLGARLLLHSGGDQASDARLVLLAAWRLLEHVSRRSERLERSQGVRLELRVGIDTGMVQVGHDGCLLGLTDVRAGQLEQAAAPGTALVSELTRQVAERHATFTQRGALQLTGDARPMAVHSAEQTESNTSGASPLDAKEGPLVGRDAEMETILGHVRAAESGVGGAFLLSGEPGIGKSRLLREARGAARAHGHAVCECSCLPEHRNSALRPVLALVQVELGLLEASSPEVASEQLVSALMRSGVELPPAVPILCLWLSLPLPEGYRPHTLSPARQKQILFDSLARLIEGLGRGRALLMAVEDLHWADPTSMEFLHSLVGRLRRSPLVLAMTARPQLEAPFATSEVVPIALSRLDTALTAPLMRRVLGDVPAAEAVLAAVARQTDGVPLFVEEYTRMLLDAQELQLVEGRYAFTAKHASPAIPVRLRELLSERIERSGARRETVQLAAVIGRTFEHTLLCGASPMPTEELQADLDALCQADLVYRARPGAGGTYSFRHALIRDAAYDSVPARARQQAHGRVAAALVQAFEKTGHEDPALVAGHFAAATEYGKATSYGVRATNDALLRSANEETLAIARQTLVWNQANAAADPIERDRLEYEVCSLMFPALVAVSGLGSAELVQLGERTTELRARLSDGGLEPSALGAKHGELDEDYLRQWTLFQDHQFRSQFDAAVDLAEKVLAEAKAAGHRRKQLLLLPLLGQTHHFRGELAAARQRLEEALAIFQPEEDGRRWTELGVESKSQALFLLAHAAACEGYPDQASEMCVTAEAWARECGCSMFADGAVYFHAMVAYLKGDRARVEELTAPYAGLTAEAAQTQWLQAFCKQAWEWSTGQVDHSRGLIAAQLGVGRDAYVCWPETMVAETEISRGELDRASERMRGALQRVTASGERSCLPLLRRTLARASFAAGGVLTEDAEALFRGALADAEAQGARWLQLDAAVAYASALRDVGLCREIPGLLSPIMARLSEGYETPLYEQALALVSSADASVAASGVQGLRPSAQAELGAAEASRRSKVAS